MAKIEGEIYIDRPPEDVFDVVADERNEPLYNPKMTASPCFPTRRMAVEVVLLRR